MAEKKCKYCAMMIPAEAKICPYCRKKQTSTLLTFIAALFFIFLIIGVIRNMEQGQPYSKNASILHQLTHGIPTPKKAEQRTVEEMASTQPLPHTVSDIHVQALGFMNMSNKEQYKGRNIVITGVISNVFIPPLSVQMKMAKQGLSADAFIYFSDQPASDVTETLIGNGVSCYLDESLAAKASQIYAGQTITLRCKYKNENILEACTLADENPESGFNVTPLENGLSCKDTPKPYEIISQLLKAKKVSNTNLGYDSIAYFKVIKPLYVWGLKVKYIYGHDEEVGEPYYSKVFVRAAGTSPGHFIGVIVAEPIDSVKGKLAKFNFKKMNIGYEEEEFGIPAGANISCHRSHDLTDDPAPVKQAIAVPSVNNSGIETTIRNYYQSIQDKRIEEAIKAFSTEKIPKLNIDLIVKIGKNTEYYKIDSINVTSNDGTHAQTTVRLRHKKYDNYEENWEIYVSLINENGVWKIVSTPGRML